MTPGDFNKMACAFLRGKHETIAPTGDVDGIAKMLCDVYAAGIAEGVRRAATAVAESKTEKLPASTSYASAREAWGCDEPGRRRP